LDAPDRQICRRHVWKGDRAANKARSAQAALALLRDYLAHL